MRFSHRKISFVFWFCLAAGLGGCSPHATAVLPDIPAVPIHTPCPPPADAPMLSRGKKAYVRVCASCHQMDGRGVPGIFPPLAGHAGRLAQNSAGRAYLVHLVLWGLSGPVTADGRTYQNVMPPQASLLDDDDVAAVLSYITYSFDNCQAFASMPVFEPGEVKKRRQGTASGLETFELRRRTDFAPPP